MSDKRKYTPGAMDKPRCSVVVFSGSYAGHACPNKGKVHRDGDWYCGVHDPVRAAERRAKQKKKGDAEFQAYQERVARQDAERKERNRRADLFPELVDALNSIANARPSEWEPPGDALDFKQWAQNIARAAITKAKALGITD